MAQTCNNPSCSAPGTKRCSGCAQVHYCSGACQKLNWRSHKTTCKRTPITPSTCNNPSCSAPGTKRCGRCNQVHYCSSACQKLDWCSHKTACKRTPSPPAAEAVPQECSNTGCAARPEQLAQPCARCKSATYCSTLCQREDWEDHKLYCPDAKPTGGNPMMVATTMIHSRAEGGRYSVHCAMLSDSIYSTSAVPISVVIGYPLLVQRVEKIRDDWVPRTRRGGAKEDNQHATWLMIDPVTGFAPAEWQGGVGNVIVARADGGYLETGTLAAITDYVSDILDAFGHGVGAARKFYNRARLDKFIADHGKMQRQYKDFQERIARGENPDEAAKTVYY